MTAHVTSQTATRLSAGRWPRWSRLPRTVSPALPLTVLGLLVFMALAAPLLAPHDPLQASLRDSLLPPAWVSGGSSEHPLGTDAFGRDVLSRLIYGGRVSLGTAALALLIATFVGTFVGVLAGYFGGWIDSVLMRFVDMILVLPMLLVALALAIALGPSFSVMVTVIGLLIWPRVARLVRGETLLIKESEFVQYAESIGVSRRVIIIRHVVPNAMPALLVIASLEIAAVILLEAALSFLGAGIPAPQPSWGGMISEGQALIATNGWWIALFPGVAIMVTVIVFNTLGDWLRDRFDPRLRDI